MDFSRLESFVEGQILLIDKPLDWTSFDVVNKIRYHLRRALQVKKFKVGHAGTLDPLASGVLIVCTGKATKKIDLLQAQSKSYTATIRLGASTPCLDAELPVDEWFDTGHISSQDMERATRLWTGWIDQQPPQYSAKKVKGEKAYAVARKGGEVELKSARVHIERFDLVATQPHRVDGHDVIDATVEIDCSKGTYIRSMARDLGQSLNVGGHLTGLQRTRNGAFSLEDCWSLEAVIQAIDDLTPAEQIKAVDV